MKKVLTLSIILASILLFTQAMAQVETKQDKKKQTTKITTSQTTSKPDIKSSQEKDTEAKSQSGMTSMSSAKEVKSFFNQVGNVTATMSKDGTIRDTRGRVLGRYTSGGQYISPTGEKAGYVEENIIRTEKGNIFATIRDDGRVYDSNSKYLGTVDDKGTVLNSRGMRMGSAPEIDKSVVVLYYFFPKQAPMPEMKKSGKR